VLRRRKSGDYGEPDEVYPELRTQALDALEGNLPAPCPEHPDVYGIVVDIPRKGATATVVALTDTTTNLYTSVGTGTVGAGANPGVAEATHRLLTAVQADLHLFTLPDDGALPETGFVRFHVLSAEGGTYCDVAEKPFWGRAPREYKAVVAGVHDVLTGIREFAEMTG
jgi:hypothetical protein